MTGTANADSSTNPASFSISSSFLPFSMYIMYLPQAAAWKTAMLPPSALNTRVSFS
jgi:hypothetical protein